MATETLSPLPRSPRGSVLDRAIDLSRVNWEVLAYAALIILSTIAHLWNLGAMALHHDESIHAWTSWRYYMGQGNFTCALGNTADSYCYDPVYHGPSLYMLTLLSYFLFGDGDAQARLPMAVAGIGLAISCWWLRPYLGRRGALIAAVLLSFSPSILYYTRFARHDGLMVLWELWMVIGVFRYLDTGKAGYLYLLAASLALAVGTHELYYILFFIFGILLLARMMAESAWSRFLTPTFLVLLALTGVGSFALDAVPLPVGEGLYLGEKTMLVFVTLLLAWLCSLMWDPRPLILPRLRELWENQRTTLWVALGILVGLYTVMYTNFFSYPRGALDGLYTGLAYWLGSQQAYARGDQPWYYYLMQLGIYEPLGMVCALVAAAYLFTRGFGFVPGLQHRLLGSTPHDDEHTNGTQTDGTNANDAAPASGSRSKRRKGKNAVPVDDPDSAPAPAAMDAASVTLAHETTSQAAHSDRTRRYMPLFPLIMVAWYFSAIVLFSWAGEKMPWLTVHMALPGNIVAAWVLAKLLDALPWGNRAAPDMPDATPTTDAQAHADQPDARPAAPAWMLWAVPPTLVVLVITLAVATARLQTDTEGQVGQSTMLQGLAVLALAGMLIFALLTLAQRMGTKVFAAMAGLTLAVVLSGYMVRASWLAVYTHPDVPIELLVYTQTSPDVPRYVEYIRELAINQTRNHRSPDDITGGYTMPVVISNGDGSGAGSLAWPMQWYLRDFQRVTWMNADQLSEATPNTFDVELPGGETGPAPVLMLFKPHVTNDTRAVLEETYVQPFGETGVFNWWFPEGNKCDPASPGYKQYYFDSWTSADQISEAPPVGCAEDIYDQVRSPIAPLLWPFNPANWGELRSFMLFRELPAPLSPGSRDMEVWVRSDLVNGVPGAGGAVATTGGSGLLRLAATQEVGTAGDLMNPTSIVVDERGMIYVADTQNHRIQIFAPDGSLDRSIGTFGADEGQFFEPRGLAVDDDGYLYVSDTWNARIVKIDLQDDDAWVTTWGTGDQDLGGGRMATITDGISENNEATPLGLFGPRGLAIGADGNVYIADTGNKRVVVTSNEGDYLYQWGSAGSAPGEFNEPTDVAIDGLGRVYVADTWNGRVQIFETGTDNVTSAVPLTTWSVPGWEANTYDDPALGVREDGQVYVSIPARQRVLAMTPFGEPVVQWGGAGNDAAALNSPSGIATGPDGQVYVVDRSSARVLAFELPNILPPTSDADQEG